jgi:hypothetical protein
MPTMLERLRTGLKKLSGTLSDGMLFSGRPELLPMDLDRDFKEIDHLLKQEEWPLLRSDLELSHDQPKATAYVARKEGDFAGFFMTHHFGEVGYLDLMIITKAFRRKAVARPLYFKTIRELKRKGIRSLVLHTTNDSARIIRLLGFKKGQTYTLLARDPQVITEDLSQDVTLLDSNSRDSIIDLDARVFGTARPEWIDGILKRPVNTLYGIKHDDKLSATLCLRPRENDAYCLDLANSENQRDLQRLVDGVLAHHANHRLECIVKTDGALHRHLLSRGFFIPDFFKSIGPLTEWKKGKTGNIGTSDHMQCLSWF